MKNFDLNAFGVSELGNRQLIEVNGGQPISPWWSVASTLIQAACILLENAVDDLCKRASKDGYIMYADIGHR